MFAQTQIQQNNIVDDTISSESPHQQKRKDNWVGTISDTEREAEEW